VISKPITLLESALKEILGRFWNLLNFFFRDSTFELSLRAGQTHTFTLYNKINWKSFTCNRNIKQSHKHLPLIDQFPIYWHTRWSLLDLCMHKSNNQRFPEYHISLFRQRIYRMFNILVITEVNFFRKIKTFFHANTKISNSFNLLPFWPITNSKLRHPNTINESLIILNNIVEDKIKKNK